MHHVNWFNTILPKKIIIIIAHFSSPSVNTVLVFKSLLTAVIFIFVIVRCVRFPVFPALCLCITVAVLLGFAACACYTKFIATQSNVCMLGYSLHVEMLRGEVPKWSSLVRFKGRVPRWSSKVRFKGEVMR